jgi:serine protease Do
VVQIFARTYSPQQSDTGAPLLTSENSTSSGVIVSPDGYILTNAHAVRGARAVRVYLSDTASGDSEPGDTGQGTAVGRDRGVPATIVGLDTETDLALIKVALTNLPYLSFAFGDSDQLKQGQLVLALGNPLGLDNSVSLGVVSATARQLKPEDPVVYIQTDAPINPGNSGGPLVDAGGRVVGINTFILSQSGGSEGIGFAIPSNLASQVYSQLKTQAHVHRAQLGLVAQTINPIMADALDLETAHGVIVSDLEPDGPAAGAGIKADDIIVGVNGKRIGTIRQLENSVYRQPPEAKINLQIRRGSERVELTVEPEEKKDALHNLAENIDPHENSIPHLGVIGLNIDKTLLQIVSGLRRPQGVLVAIRNPDMPYSGQPLEAGDAIYEVNRHVVATIEELRSALGKLSSGDAIVLLVERDAQLIYVPLELN